MCSCNSLVMCVLEFRKVTGFLTDESMKPYLLGVAVGYPRIGDMSIWCGFYFINKGE